MKLVLSLLVVCLVAVSAYTFEEYRGKLVDVINNSGTTWTATSETKFSSYDQVKRLCGSLKTPQELRLPRKTINVNLAAIPDSFDSRTAWPECPTIGEIRDQSSCGSCWAFGATEAASDRVCIGTNGTKIAHLSAEHLVGCCLSCGMGCDGGYPSAAWSWFARVGCVTGGNYGDFSWCSAYSLPWCEHHTTGGQYEPCPSTEYSTPSCPTKCDSNSTYNVTFDNDHHKFASSYSVGSSEAEIQTEIMTHGPVEGAFTVYADFEAYKGGVYQHVTGEELGGHAIRILGWGVDSGVKYWLVANSWNSDWGEKGFFRIRRGVDECGIEDEIVAGLYKA